jgi:hypothetical protein
VTDARDDRGGTSERQRPGRRTTGQSGMPRGGRQGSRWRLSKRLDAIGEANAQGIVNAMIVKALGGDVSAAEVVLKRLWPVRIGRPLKIPIRIPIADLVDVGAALDLITSAVATGELSAEEAAHLCALIDHRRKLIDEIDLEARIAALEAMAGAKR